MDLMCSSVWAVSPDHIVDVRQVLCSEHLQLERAREVLSVSLVSPTGSDAVETPANVALIPVSGLLMKRSMWSIDMQDIARAVQEAASDNHVSGIVLLMDTPGGQVNGIVELGKVITAARERKPVVAVVDGLCCSAGYWLASCAGRIFCSNRTVQVGSIGVMASFFDTIPAMEKDGFRYHEVYSSLSQDKNKLENELLQGKYDNYRKEVLDPLAQLFIDHVRGMRPGVSDEALTGKTYFPDAAISVGLADQIGSVQEAVDYIVSDMQYNPKTNMTMKQFTRIEAVLGNLEMNDGGVFLNQEQLEALENVLPAAGGDDPEPVEPAGPAPDANPSTDAAVLDRINELEARLADLEKQPAADGGGAPTATDFNGRNENAWDYAN